jgi:ABC-type amino acid transport substrate-binding protein
VEETMQRLRKMQTVTTILAFLAGVVLVVISAAPPPPLTTKAGDAWAGYSPPVLDGGGR